MTTTAPSTNWPSLPRRTYRLLWIASFALFALTSRGYLQSIDVVETFRVAVNALQGHGVALYSQGYFPGWPVRGVGGQYFAPHALGQSLLYVPFAFLYTSHLLSLGMAHWVATFLDPALGATVVVVATAFAFDLVPRRSLALLTGVSIATTSLLWPYASVAFDVLPTALALLIAFWQWHRADQRDDPLHLFWVSLALACALLERVDASVWVVLVSAVIVVDMATTRASWRRMAPLFFAPLVLAVFLTAWYNAVRFGSVWNDGHASDPNFVAVNAPWSGALALFLSPAKGLLEYCPPLLLAVVGGRRMWRTAPRLAAGAVLAVVTTAGLVGTHRDWFGGQSWGPRFLVPAVPLLCLPLVFVFDKWRDTPRTRRAAAAGVLGWGFLVQLAGATSGATLLVVPTTGPTTGPAWQHWLPIDAIHLFLDRMGWFVTHGSFAVGHTTQSLDVWWLLPAGAATPSIVGRACWLSFLLAGGLVAGWRLWRECSCDAENLDLIQK